MADSEVIARNKPDHDLISIALVAIALYYQPCTEYCTDFLHKKACHAVVNWKKRFSA